MNFRRPVLATLAVMACLAPLSPVYAADEMLAISEQIKLTTNKTIEANTLKSKELLTTINESAEKTNALLSGLNADEFKRQDASNVDFNFLGSLRSVPGATAFSQQVAKDILNSRYNELNRIPLDIDTATDGDMKRAEYLIDTTAQGGNIDTQTFDVFMRYFCDPLARNAEMKNFAYPITDLYRGKTKVSYTLGCGKVSGGSDAETRQKILGSDDTSAEAKQLIGLPLQPAKLFFNPVTYPSKVSGDTKEVSNTNRLAKVYEGAFAQSLQFLIGSAPPAGSSINTQAAIARRMLVSYPFAILFSERVGNLGSHAAVALGEVMKGRYDVATQDPVLLQRIADIQNRKKISMAEYMDIVMYQFPMSPGYYRYISTEENIYKLKREAVWLSAMQTALAYQRNRWLEILAALEAVK